jgi:hypothetical protein
VRTYLRTAKLLAFLVSLAIALAWLISGKAVATSTFQSPPVFDSALPTPTVQLTASPTSSATSSPEPTLPPTPEATPEPLPSPTRSGFLPPPTLTSPGTPVPAGPSVQPLGDLPVRDTTPEAPSEDESQSGADSPTTLAGLIDQGVLALGYLWLCCGVVALFGVGGLLVWFFRRSRRG